MHISPLIWQNLTSAYFSAARLHSSANSLDSVLEELPEDRKTRTVASFELAVTSRA